MIVPVPRSRRTAEEHVLPLINIVFLLLVFFMITGALSASAPFPLDPPRTHAAGRTEPPREGIAIAADGRVAFAGEVIEVDELATRARRWRAGAETGEVLTVRADTGASTEHLFRVFDALRASGIETVRLLSIGDTDSE